MKIKAVLLPEGAVGRRHSSLFRYMRAGMFVLALSFAAVTAIQYWRVSSNLDEVHAELALMEKGEGQVRDEIKELSPKPAEVEDLRRHVQILNQSASSDPGGIPVLLSQLESAILTDAALDSLSIRRRSAGGYTVELNGRAALTAGLQRVADRLGAVGGSLSVRGWDVQVQGPVGFRASGEVEK